MNCKRIIYLLAALILPLLSFADDHVQALFEKGNKEYAKGQYKQAMADYQQVLNGGYQSAALYFNMGNAGYKDGDIATALLYYEKARRISPGDDDINFNIRLVNLKTTDKIDEVPEFFLTKWWTGFILAISDTALAVWGIVFIFAASLIFIAYLFTQSVAVKKASFYVSIILIFLGLFTLFIGNRQANYFDSHHQAIVFSGASDVKSSPAAAAKTLFVIHEGTKVDVLETNNGWTKIRLPNGNVGWIVVGDAKEI